MRTVVKREDLDLFVEKCGSVPEDYSKYTQVDCEKIDKVFDMLFDVNKEGSDKETEIKEYPTNIYKFEDLNAGNY